MTLKELSDLLLLLLKFADPASNVFAWTEFDGEITSIRLNGGYLVDVDVSDEEVLRQIILKGEKE